MLKKFEMINFSNNYHGSDFPRVLSKMTINNDAYLIKWLKIVR